ncbi:MAG: class I SAM-dependent methyltransferase [bacterium]|nr:class I SAM-dependent methyltransferase [bacterium]
MLKQDDPELPPMTAKDYSEANDWSGYFGAVLGQGARKTLVLALDRFEQEGIADGFAVDLAAGEGRDTLEILRRGWRVVATDSHPEAFTHLWPRVSEAVRARLSTLEVVFSDTEIPNCDLVNASYALPFCESGDFDGLWSGIVAAIRPGGRFAGQFFGNRDSWASRPDRTHHAKDEVLRLLAGFEIEMMDEEESDDEPDERNPKHWHMFHVVAKKR